MKELWSRKDEGLCLATQLIGCRGNFQSCQLSPKASSPSSAALMLARASEGGLHSPLPYASPRSSFLLPPEFSSCRVELLRFEDPGHGCTCAGHMLTLFLQSFPSRQRRSYFFVCYVHPVKFSKLSRQGLKY